MDVMDRTKTTGHWWLVVDVVVVGDLRVLMFLISGLARDEVDW